MLVVSAAFLTGVAASAQTGSIKGKVTDASNGEPMVSATVILRAQGTGNSAPVAADRGRISKRDGTFQFIEIPPGSYTIRVTYVGYQTTTQNIVVRADQETTADIAMTPDPKGITEIVITGVASRKEKSVSEVAVSRIDMEEITDKGAFQDISQALAGKTPGVTVSPSSGNVGGGIRFNVRSGAGLYGSSQPVIFVDGVRMNNAQLGTDVGGQGVSALAGLNPQDIADIQILKGPAATALYGTSGSDGVVLITTKLGSARSGNAATVQLRSIIGVNQQAVEYTPEMVLSYNDVNAVHRDGAIREYQASVGGSSNGLEYYTSFGSRNEEGLLYGNDMIRNSARANFRAFPNEHMTVNVSADYTAGETGRTHNDNSIVGPLAETLTFGPDADGVSRSYPDVDSLSISMLSNRLRSDRFMGSIEVTSDIVDNLLLRGVVGYDGLTTREDAIYPQNGNYQNIGIISGSKTVTNEEYKRMNFDLSAQYDYNLTENLWTSSTIGMQGFISSLRTADVRKDSFATYRVSDLSSGSKFKGATDDFLESREAGIFFQQDFSLDDTYMFHVGIRNDYASAIGPDAPSIFYPNAGGAVRLDKLDLFPSSVNLFKVRAAYGASGILPRTLDASGIRWGGEPSGSGPGGVITVIGNPAIEPESVSELEVGLEVEMDHAYGAEITYYTRSASNSIIDFRNPPSTGLTATAIPRNVGAINSWGVESHLYAMPINTQDYGLNLDLIWNYQDNEVTDLGGAQPIFDAFGINVIKEGFSRSSFYDQKVTGAIFDPTTGEYLGPQVDTFRSYLGTPIPNHTGSFLASFRFLGDFTVSALTDWTLGQSTLNMIRLYNVVPFYQNNGEYAVLATQLGIAESVGTIPQAGVEPLTVGSAEYRAAAERIARLDYNYMSNFVEESDFIRLREVSLSYNMSGLLGDVTNNVVKNLAITLSARNLWLSTKYSYPDPEVNSDGARSLTRGLDFGALQNPRTLNAMITLGF